MVSRQSWVLDEDERCEQCEQTYALELEVRCVICDGPVCPFCVVSLGETPRCPEHREVD